MNPYTLFVTIPACLTCCLLNAQPAVSLTHTAYIWISCAPILLVCLSRLYVYAYNTLPRLLRSCFGYCSHISWCYIRIPNECVHMLVFRIAALLLNDCRSQNLCRSECVAVVNSYVNYTAFLFQLPTMYRLITRLSVWVSAFLNYSKQIAMILIFDFFFLYICQHA